MTAQCFLSLLCGSSKWDLLIFKKLLKELRALLPKQNTILCHCFLRQTRWPDPDAVHFSLKARDEPLILLESSRLCHGTMGGRRKHKQWFPQQQFNPLALKPDTKWTKARRLARINLWISRLSMRKKKKRGSFVQKGPLSAFEVGETCQPSSASLCERPPCPTANHHLTFICPSS